MTDPNDNPDAPCIEYEQRKLDDVRVELRFVLLDEDMAERMPRPAFKLSGNDATTGYCMHVLGAAAHFIESLERAGVVPGFVAGEAPGKLREMLRFMLKQEITRARLQALEKALAAAKAKPDA